MIKWNEEYKVYVSDDGKLFNKDMREYKLNLLHNGYLRWQPKRNNRQISILVHRIIWETFNNKIPNSLEIDHINRIKTDNRLINLRLVTRSDNLYNREVHFKSIFGKKYLDHFGANVRNKKQYDREYSYWLRHNKCSWE
jgi:hypothetical protein